MTGRPKRVFKFRSYEEFEDWKIAQRLGGRPVTPELYQQMKLAFRERDRADCIFLQQKIAERENK